MIIKYIQYCVVTMNRQNWTSEEDSQLREVVQKNGSEDWTRNAEILREISSTAQDKKRTGKQCRERWYNHLDPGVVKTQWQPEEENCLFQMHKVHGNKWKQLTRYLPGRTDNDIKNHFYSTLRRSLRRLNKYMGQKNSTSQMREIKPSVLTFIINHIYGQEIKENDNKNLIDSLKQLPELIFKFSSFKPVKQNMDKKIDESLRDRITLIMTLVQQFKQLYRKQKNQDLEQSHSDRKGSRKLENRQTLAIPEKSSKPKKNVCGNSNSNFDGEEDKGYDGDDADDGGQYGSQVKQEFEDLQEEDEEEHPMSLEQIWNSNPSSKKSTKQFIPIVTIQRKPSNYDQKHPNPNPKKLILIPKTEPLLPEPPLRALSFHEQELPDDELMPIEEPSMSMNENSQFFGDLVVIGKHIEPIECQATNQQQNFCEIDQILYQNYQN